MPTAEDSWSADKYQPNNQDQLNDEFHNESNHAELELTDKIDDIQDQDEEMADVDPPPAIQGRGRGRGGCGSRGGAQGGAARARGGRSSGCGGGCGKTASRDAINAERTTTAGFGTPVPDAHKRALTITLSPPILSDGFLAPPTRIRPSQNGLNHLLRLELAPPLHQFNNNVSKVPKHPLRTTRRTPMPWHNMADMLATRKRI